MSNSIDKANKAMENVSNNAHNASNALTGLSEEAQKIVEKYAEHQEKIYDHSQVFTYFFDKEGKDQVETYKVKKKVKKYKQNQEYEEEEIIDTGKIKLSFPNVTVQGESQSMILYMRNNLKSTIELDPYTLDKHLTITEFPKKLKSKEYGRLRLTFSPSYKRFEALTEELGQWGFNYTILTKE